MIYVFKQSAKNSFIWIDLEQQYIKVTVSQSYFGRVNVNIQGFHVITFTAIVAALTTAGI